MDGVFDVVGYYDSSAPQTGGAPAPTVTGMTATPSAFTIAGGGSRSITIAVQGANSPGQGYTSSKVSGVGSVTGGAITAPAGTSSTQSGTFRFRSAQDTAYYVDVVMTVAAVVAPPDSGTINVTKVPASRIVVFEGNKRVVTFEGNKREVKF